MGKACEIRVNTSVSLFETFASIVLSLVIITKLSSNAIRETFCEVETFCETFF